MPNHKTGLLWVVALVAGIFGGVCALTGQHYLQSNDAPGIAVINLGALIQTAAQGQPVDNAAIQQGFSKMRQIGEALAAKGHLVLDASAVINAPADYYVPGPPAPGQRHQPLGDPINPISEQTEQMPQ